MSLSLLFPYLSVSLASTLSVSCLTVLRFMYHRSHIAKILGGSHGTIYVSFAAMIIESASIYAICSLLYIIPYATGSPLANAFLQILGMAQVRSTFPHTSSASMLCIMMLIRGVFAIPGHGPSAHHLSCGGGQGLVALCDTTDGADCELNLVSNAAHVGCNDRACDDDVAALESAQHPGHLRRRGDPRGNQVESFCQGGPCMCSVTRDRTRPMIWWSARPQKMAVGAKRVASVCHVSRYGDSCLVGRTVSVQWSFRRVLSPLVIVGPWYSLPGTRMSFFCMDRLRAQKKKVFWARVFYFPTVGSLGLFLC